MANKIYRPRMPKETQKTVAWIVRSYPRLILQRQAILEASPRSPEVPGKSGLISDPTGQTVSRLEKTTRYIDAIESARSAIDTGYVNGVWENCVYRKPFPDYAHENTWKRQKNRFLYAVAAELGMPLENDYAGTARHSL